MKPAAKRETAATGTAPATTSAATFPSASASTFAAGSVYRAYGAGSMPAEERERLILEHLPQVRLIARRIHDRLPESVNLEDLISTGTLGLIAAIDRFDPRHNVKLKTYAEYK